MSDWFTTLGLIFGGCCSNAISLEQITSKYPDSGILITFFQFLIISLHGLPKHVILSDGRIPYPRLRPRRIPLTPYLVQVTLFYLVSLLNNAAFGYRIPMPVHIIFRSGGLIISMLLGMLIVGKRYTLLQAISVFVVTVGVALTTLSPSPPMSAAQSTMDTSFAASYAMGVIILIVALIFAGLLGLVQDWTISKYTHSLQTSSASDNKFSGKAVTPKLSTRKAIENNSVPAWQESLFYLHFLAMPMFLFVWQDLIAQFQVVHAGAHFEIPLSVSGLHHLGYVLLTSPATAFSTKLSQSSTPTIAIPLAYVPLLVNTITQLFCAAGVHKLTGKVSSLTVTLTLVVRKAVSLVISVLLYGGGGVSNEKLWGGALLVMVGTVGYSMGGKKGPASDNPRKKKE